MRRLGQVVFALLLLAAIGLVDAAGRRERQAFLGDLELPPESFDPALAAGTVALGGARALAVNALWVRAEHRRLTQEFWDLPQLYRLIQACQPRLGEVFHYHALVLAFDAAAQERSEAARYEWNRMGLETIQRGLAHNPRADILHYGQAVILLARTTLGDERAFARRFQRDRPLNPQGLAPLAFARQTLSRARALNDHDPSIDHLSLTILAAMIRRAQGDAAELRAEAADVAAHMAQRHPDYTAGPLLYRRLFGDRD